MSATAKEVVTKDKSAKCLSYLLVLDGSAEAMAAARFAWDLATATQAKVVAQHVLDTPASWGTLSYRLPGFVGSGVYVEAHKKITEALRSIAETIMLAYQTQAEGHHQNTENFIDEGDKVTEICHRAAEHDLVIIGQLSTDDSAPADQSLAYRISAHCQKPVIIAKMKPLPRAEVHLSIANRSFNEAAVDEVLAFAKSAGVPVD